MASYTELKILAESRMNEAKVLNENGHSDGAIYLAGYVVEFALKARICKNLGLDNYPDRIKGFKEHSFENLIILAGLYKSWNQMKADSIEFNSNWNVISNWAVDLRYTYIEDSNKSKTLEYLNSLEGEFGIFTWIKTLW